MKNTFFFLLILVSNFIFSQNFVATSSDTPLIGFFSSDVKFLDFDSDGDKDLIISGQPANGVVKTSLYINNGNENFTLSNNNSIENVSASSLDYADIDNDGDYDILIQGLQLSLNGITKLYLNDGFGNFNESSQVFEGLYQGTTHFEDIDNDNDLDILISGTNGSLSKVILYQNDGLGNFIEISNSTIIGVSGPSQSIDFLDIDNDNDSDLIITGSDDNNSPVTKLYSNDGNGVFSEIINTPFITVSQSSVDFSDIDGDNDLDIIIMGTVGNNQYNTTLYTNDGNGNFTANSNSITGIANLGNGVVKFFDIDQDDDEDLLISGRFNGNNFASAIYENNGAGNFVLMSDNPILRITAGSMDVEDIDNDGDYDFILNGITYATSILVGTVVATEIYMNDGIGGFEAKVDEFEDISSGRTEFIDIDNDGFEDLILLGNSNDSAFNIQFYYNDGQGNFTQINNPQLPPIYKGDAKLFDLDNDGDQDLVIAGKVVSSPSFIRTYLNDGSGNFTLSYGYEDIDVTSIAIDDVDLDGFNDILFTGTQEDPPFGAESILLMNDGGNGWFNVSNTLQITGSDLGDLQFVDFDSDNDSDLLVTGFNSSNNPISLLYTNDGSGNFTEVTNSNILDLGFTRTQFVDVDNDADADLFILGREDSTNNSEIYKLYTNDGNGNYSEASSAFLEPLTMKFFKFFDLDSDGDKDLLAQFLNQDNTYSTKFYFNDGAGNFAESNEISFQIPTGLIKIDDVDISDVDNDNDVDLFMSGLFTDTEELYFTLPISRLFLNNDSGNFTELLGFMAEDVEDSSVVFFDSDNDNDLDLIIAGFNGNLSTSLLYENNGSNNFGQLSLNSFQGVSQGDISSTDIDNDGYMDLLITGKSNSNNPITKLYRNIGNSEFLEISSAIMNVDKSQTNFFDFENDGDDDLLVSGWDGNQAITKLYLNDGSGNFTNSQTSIFENIYNGSTEVFDIDGDLDEDIFMTGISSNDSLISLFYINVGGGNFTQINSNITPVSDSSVDFSDVDNDNDIDIFASGLDANQNTVSKLLLNNGSGIFNENLTTVIEPVYKGSSKFGDFDNDTFTDLIVTGLDSSNKQISDIYFNDGSGNFIKDTNLYFQGLERSSIAVADVDEDNDNDIVFTGRNNYGLPTTRLFLNQLNTLNVEIYMLEDESNEFIIYPNPIADEILKIEYQTQGLININLYDISGRLKMSLSKYIDHNADEINLDVSSLSSGKYILQIVDKKKHLTKSFLKK